jgi:hypothetical protein
MIEPRRPLVWRRPGRGKGAGRSARVVPTRCRCGPGARSRRAPASRRHGAVAIVVAERHDAGQYATAVTVADDAVVHPQGEDERLNAQDAPQSSSGHGHRTEDGVKAVVALAARGAAGEIPDIVEDVVRADAPLTEELHRIRPLTRRRAFRTGVRLTWGRSARSTSRNRSPDPMTSVSNSRRSWTGRCSCHAPRSAPRRAG